jgi:hypothetical protein
MSEMNNQHFDVSPKTSTFSFIREDPNALYPDLDLEPKNIILPEIS